MIRRTFLRLLVLVATGLAAGAAPADPVDDIIAEIRAQGFKIVRVQRTWLGRVRIIGQNAELPPRGGHRPDDRRDPPRPPDPEEGLPARPRAPAPRPELGSSRDIGKIEEEPGARRTPSRTRATGRADWGGGWGSAGRAGRSGTPARARMARMHRRGGASAARRG